MSVMSGNANSTVVHPPGGRSRGDARYQQHQPHQSGSMVKPQNEPAELVKRALDFKTQGTQCYKDKKYREAIGKYHRALLEMKGLCRVLGDPDTSKSPSTVLTTISKSSLTDEQKGAVENAELECYNSLAGGNIVFHHLKKQYFNQLTAFYVFHVQRLKKSTSL